MEILTPQLLCYVQLVKKESKTYFTLVSCLSVYAYLLMNLEQDNNGEELQLQVEILSEHFQHISGLQKNDLSSNLKHWNIVYCLFK